MYQLGSKYCLSKGETKMEMLAMLSGLPCILVIVWGLAYVWFISKGYTPTKWYKLIGIILVVLSLLDVFVVNADLYPKY